MKTKGAFKKTAFFLLIFLQLFYSKAQSFDKVTWSEPLTPAVNGHLCGLYGNKDFSFLVFTDRDHAFTQISLVGFDQDGKTQKADYTLAQPAQSCIGAFVQNGQMAVVLEIQRQEDGHFIQEVKKLLFTGNQLTDEKTLLSHSVTNKTHLGKIKFSVSPDRNRSLVFCELPFKPGANEEVQIFAYDAQGKEEKHGITLYIESKMGVHNYPHLANNGDVYFMKRDKDKSQQYRYYVYAFQPGSNTLSHKAISLPGTSISDIRGTVTPQNEFLVGGFTSSQNLHEYEGYFLMKLDASCMPKSRAQAAFDETSLLKFISKKEMSKNPAVPNYFIENISVGPTGKIYIAAEAYEEGEAYYQYKDIMLVCFNESGAYKTTFKVSKNQGAREGYTHWASYKAFYNNDTLVTLHNNLAKIEGEKGPEPLLQLNKVHEKFGAVPATGYAFNAPSPTAFFNPDAFMQENEQHFTAVFSDLQRKTFRLVRVDL